jgi:hypothetical protein
MRQAVIILAVMVLAAGAACAHQPRIAFGSRHTRQAPINVEKPEISKAYYGNLTGEPDYYRIDSAKAFKLYINILTPDKPGARTDTEVEVAKDGEVITTIGGSAAKWDKFYEKYAADSYLRGQEFAKTAGPGIYYIRVYNSDNRGKYSLAIGDVESFPLDETIKTAFTLPVIKKEFFNKSAISAFLNPVGGFLAAELAIAIGMACLALFIIRMLIKRTRANNRTL